MTTSQINQAIQHLNLEIIHQRGSGYSYFLDTSTGDQIGASVSVCYLNALSLEQWVQEAEAARNPSTIGHEDDVDVRVVDRVVCGTPRSAHMCAGSGVVRVHHDHDAG